MRLRNLSFLSLVLAASMLAGCSILPHPKGKPIQQYEISPKSPGKLAGASASCLTIRVDSMSVSPPFDTTAMLYTEQNYEIQQYAYHQWAATPDRMLTDSLVAALTSSQLYKTVLGPQSDGNADVILSSSLVRGPLQAFSSSKSSTENLTVKMTLSDGDSSGIIASRRFEASVKASPNAYGGVKAANIAWRRMLDEIVAWLNKNNSYKKCN